ncbi:unnamed protein product [Adineta steineri]|uniref:Uncharacterized protein n=1 Tax=Adineta steineri TaxID=433720 RepID=A0A819SQB0_9BILA|nr:unnamed protein product [Adineta steineri]CAF0971327.1 unnamed protein product [Adineta steineri]CAF3814876.1 unnamed protein product [Adineta steineri]CAF4065651.1 unnamed protein product [Adineta steineri]
MNLQKYLDEFNEGVFAMNSSSLCTLLSIRHKGHIEKFSSANACDLFEKYGRVVQDWNVILTNHIKICQILLYQQIQLTCTNSAGPILIL